jgi:beta-hydroxylase
MAEEQMSAALALLTLLLVCAIVSELDRRGSRRSVWDHYRNRRFLMSPMNALILAATPAAMRSRAIVPITRATFPNVHVLRDAFSIIQAEALRAYGASKPIQSEQFFTSIADAGWKRFYLKWYTASCDPLALQLCPQTCALVQSMPNVHLAMFSILEPGSRIRPHSGLFRGCYRYHLGLRTPQSDECFISIGGERYSWRDGEDVLFDDTFEHYVVNNTSERRIVLFLDVERPLYAPTARALNAAFIQRIAPLSTRANDKQEAASLQRA